MTPEAQEKILQVTRDSFVNGGKSMVICIKEMMQDYGKPFIPTSEIIKILTELEVKLGETK